VQAGAAIMRITALRDDIIRVRIAPDALPEDASWAVVPEARSKSVNVQSIDESSFVGFRTAALEVRVENNPARIVIQDLSGNVISADSVGRPVTFRSGGFSVHKAMLGGEHFFGLGDKTGGFDRGGQAYTLWNTDVGPQESVDPLYKSIPFFLAIHETRSYGIFLDNTWRTWFDFGKSARDAYAFGSEGGPLDYYFIYGPSPKQVVENYAYLTGKPPLPPMWALGFQQSRYSYFPESQLREIATRLRNDRIPSDVVYLDIDYQDRNRPFTVNTKAFPDFSGLVSDLRKQHLHLVNITDLHIAHAPNQGYSPYDTGHAGDHFVKNPDGSEFVGAVWPGPAVSVVSLALVGAGYGLISGLTAAAVAVYWRRALYGRIASRIYLAWCTAAVVLPIGAGRLFDVTQGYGTAIVIAAGGNVLGILIALGLPRERATRANP